MDVEALNEWTRIDKQYDAEIDRLLASGAVAPQDGSPIARRLAELRRRRADAEGRLRRSFTAYAGTPPGAPAPDTGSIVVLGRD